MQKWVLVVDDSPDHARTLTVLLSQCNCEVRVANSAKEAIALVAGMRFDLLLIDLVMPDMDGYALVAELHRRKLLRDTSAYAMTGYPVTQEEMRAAGFQGVLLKPTILQQLQNVLRIDCQ